MFNHSVNSSIGATSLLTAVVQLAEILRVDPIKNEDNVKYVEALEDLYGLFSEYETINRDNYPTVFAKVMLKAQEQSKKRIFWRCVFMVAWYLEDGTLPPKNHFCLLHFNGVFPSPYFALSDAGKDMTKVLASYHSRGLCIEQVTKYIAAKFCASLEKRGIDSFNLEEMWNFALSITSTFHRKVFISLIKTYDHIFACHWERPDTGEPFNDLELPSLKESNDYYGKGVPDEHDLGMMVSRAYYALLRYGESISMAGQYLKIMKQFRWFSFKRGVTIFDHRLLKIFIEGKRQQFEEGKIKHWKLKIVRRTVRVLFAIENNGTISKDTFRFTRISPLPNSLEQVRLQLTQHLVTEHRLAPSTIEFFNYIFRTLIKITDINSADEFAYLGTNTAKKIMEHVASVCTTKSSIKTTLRVYQKVLEWLFNMGLINTRIDPLIIIPKTVSNYISGYLTLEDQAKVIKACGKLRLRDQCIVLSAIELGLRESDILGLTLSNFDFENHRISLIQKKTKVPLVLPLTKRVEEAFKNYLENERPKPCGNDEIIILTVFPPFKPMTSVHAIVSNLLKSLRIKARNRSVKGPHLLRHSLAHGLLYNMVDHSVITDTLGHTSRASDRPYLSMDERMLFKCAFDLSFIGFSRFNNKSEE